ncbi:MAG: coenzyme F420-0:L-glutamate ligase [Syntrophomonadaceae bacterium]|nr:coenzyme F420-0:L-glutamate ligase [Syntrophomonadaceae bacterium]
MGRMPNYVGVSAFGLKMGVIVPGSDLMGMVLTRLRDCHRDELLDNGDVVCITESVLARSQNNFVSLPQITDDVVKKLGLKPDSSLGVLFPILSRNRFSMILKGLAAAVPQGRVVIQLSHPADEVGNQLLPEEIANGKISHANGSFGPDDLDEQYLHPITQVDYMDLYREIVEEQGGDATIIICNDPLRILDEKLDGVVVASIHTRHKIAAKLRDKGANCITLQDICNNPAQQAHSEWGLLGSNMSSGDKLKLAPREADQNADLLQAMVKDALGVDLEVIIYGDGAYCDPSTRIYELADPQPAFGITRGLQDRYREGLKYKYLVDKMWEEGMQLEHIEAHMEKTRGTRTERNAIESEGTTPRKAEDLIASLADLVSGSADAGTPLILVKNFLN